jgi:hypothetical protein
LNGFMARRRFLIPGFDFLEEAESSSMSRIAPPTSLTFCRQDVWSTASWPSSGLGAWLVMSPAWIPVEVETSVGGRPEHHNNLTVHDPPIASRVGFAEAHHDRHGRLRQPGRQSGPTIESGLCCDRLSNRAWARSALCATSMRPASCSPATSTDKRSALISGSSVERDAAPAIRVLVRASKAGLRSAGWR